MENQMICLDTSVLIDFLRKTDKQNSFFYKLTQSHKFFAVSVITEFEIYCGATQEQKPFWDKFFTNFVILSFDSKENEQAIEIFKNLKKRNKLIQIPDLIIGATAKAHNLPLATFNKKHFERIEGLDLVFEKKV